MVRWCTVVCLVVVCDWLLGCGLWCDWWIAFSSDDMWLVTVSWLSGLVVRVLIVLL